MNNAVITYDMGYSSIPDGFVFKLKRKTIIAVISVWAWSLSTTYDWEKMPLVTVESFKTHIEGDHKNIYEECELRKVSHTYICNPLFTIITLYIL